ncbi:MAG: hypothetical protein R3F38_17060 [Gammaproteobacteria bacterium]
MTAETDETLARELSLYLENLRLVARDVAVLRGYANNTLNTAFLDSATLTEVENLYNGTSANLTKAEEAYSRILAAQPAHPLANNDETGNGADRCRAQRRQRAVDRSLR